LSTTWKRSARAFVDGSREQLDRFNQDLAGQPIITDGDSIMTCSIQTFLNLEWISPLARKTLNAKIVSVGSPKGKLNDLYAMPTSELNLISDVGTEWEVIYDRDYNQPEIGPVPCYIYMDLNAPNATTGQDVEHGVGVFAAGTVALELIRTWLAKNGMPRVELAALSTSDVELFGTTVTYLFECSNRDDVDKLMRAIWVTACALYPRSNRLRNSSDGIITIPGQGFTVVVAPKVDVTRAGCSEGLLASAVADRMPCHVRIDVRLRPRFLSSIGLSQLSDWEDADGRGLYRWVFDTTVRRVLRLDSGLSRRAPSARVYKRLTETEAALLRRVVKQGRDPAQFQSIAESKNPSRLKLKLGLRILAVAQVDIEIPWKLHSTLCCAELADRLTYPGDHHPTAERVSQCFCRENWPRLLEQLRNRYEAASSRA
jgi:hypothetical protein